MKKCGCRRCGCKKDPNFRPGKKSSEKGEESGRAKRKAASSGKKSSLSKKR